MSQNTSSAGKDTDPLTHKEFTMFTSKLEEQLNGVIKDINSIFENIDNSFEKVGDEFTYIRKRLDDIDLRLEKLEGRSKTMEGDITNIRSDVHHVKNETSLIPKLMGTFQLNSVEIGNLTTRMKNLETHRKEET